MDWFDERQGADGIVGSNPPQLTPENELVLKAWNLMRGIEWPALDYIAALLGVEDADAFVYGLIQIREHQKANEPKDSN